MTMLNLIQQQWLEMGKKLKFKLLLHPTYSPDLTPCDYNIFGWFKDVLQGHQIVNEEVKY